MLNFNPQTLNWINLLTNINSNIETSDQNKLFTLNYIQHSKFVIIINSTYEIELEHQILSLYSNY